MRLASFRRKRLTQFSFFNLPCKLLFKFNSHLFYHLLLLQSLLSIENALFFLLLKPVLTNFLYFSHQRPEFIFRIFSQKKLFEFVFRQCSRGIIVNNLKDLLHILVVQIDFVLRKDFINFIHLKLSTLVLIKLVENCHGFLVPFPILLSIQVFFSSFFGISFLQPGQNVSLLQSPTALNWFVAGQCLGHCLILFLVWTITLKI